MGRRGHYVGNGQDDVSESDFDFWDNLPPISQASRAMQDRLLKSTPDDAKELARRILRGEA